jgi:hypothetical protein
LPPLFIALFAAIYRARHHLLFLLATDYMDKTFRITREQLKEIKLLLDTNGHTETKLKAAWRNSTNQEIAASIIWP